uniref:Uncharacterized protein n=1 Tax=Aegilops tauschii TaxID=37682 RepID=M8CLJ9_AEGTA
MGGGKNIEFITAGGRLQPIYVPQLQKLIGTQSDKKVVASPGQVSEDGDAKEARVEGEDDENLKPRKMVATFQPGCRGQQKKDAISAPSKKTRKIWWLEETKH